MGIESVRILCLSRAATPLDLNFPFLLYLDELLGELKVANQKVSNAVSEVVH